MKGFSEECLTPPSANPAKYCHFCYSQFRIEPLFGGESHSETKALLFRIESLVQVQLSPERDQGIAICFMCQHKLIEFEAFRDRCRKLHEVVRRCQPFPTLELQLEQVRNGLDEGVGCYNEADCSSLGGAIDPLSFLNDDEDVPEEDILEENDKGTVLNEACQQFNSKELKVVNSKDAKKNNRFWQVLSHDVGPIPDHVRNILELTGRCRQESVAHITPSIIKQLEESMRNAVQMLVTYEKRHGNANRKKALIKYYGEAYWKQPERFCFSEGENATMLNIAATVKRKGLRHFLKNTKEVLKKVDNSREHAEILVEKIRKYYRARDSQSEKFQSFFKQLPGPKQVQICRRPNGTIQATIRCPICRKITRAGLTNGCYWYIHNFVSHCEAKHYRTEVVKLSSAKKASLAAAKSSSRKRAEKERKPQRPKLKEG